MLKKKARWQGKEILIYVSRESLTKAFSLLGCSTSLNSTQ